MSKDVNIHVKTTGTPQTKQELDEVSGSANKLAQNIIEGQKKAGAATDESTQKLSGMGRILDNLATQAKSYIAAFIGWKAVQEILNWIIEKLERIARLQNEIYEKSLTFADIGQRIEFQTGTIGQQQYWTEQALKIQKAGALSSPAVAQQMMISADIAFAKQGGIKNQKILNMLTELSPFFGAAGLGPAETSEVFEFAGKAGIAPTTHAYKQYLAQLQAAFKASKATSFGEFMVGLRKGGSAYMEVGGTLTEALSTYSGARAVVANDELAATLVEQVARLSAGGYQKPRKVIEKALGVKWSELTMDQRTDALLQYVGSIPESQRVETLVAQGFRPELAMQIGKMVTPEAATTMDAARAAVLAATPAAAEQQNQAYLDSMLGKGRKTDVEIAEKQIKTGPKFADWQTRLKKAKAEHEILVAKGQDQMLMSDIVEPYVMAMEGLDKDLTALIGELPESERKKRATELQRRIQKSIINMQPGRWLGLGILPSYGITKYYEKGGAARKGYRLTQEFNELIAEGSAGPKETKVSAAAIGIELTPKEVRAKEIYTPKEIQQNFMAVDTPREEMRQSPTINTYNIHYHNEHIINYTPRVGSDERGPRTPTNIK
jgi:hypothetical protein